MLKIQKERQGLASTKSYDYQVGVFAYTDSGRIVLVTSRNGESWILPKGNRAKKRSDRVQVKREAFEELIWSDTRPLLENMSLFYEKFYKLKMS